MQLNSSLDAIFILGIKRRSGTNFLSDLLCQHPYCFENTIKEDYSLSHAKHLIDFADDFYKARSLAFRVQTSPKSSLYRSLGLGLLHYFSDNMSNTSNTFKSAHKINARTRIVTKTPSVRNLEYFQKLLPETPLLIVVRDGRDVVESNVRSFDYDYEHEMHEWATAAQTILQFIEAMKSSDQPYMIIKYEDLFLNSKEKLEEILQFLNLDTGVYDFSMVNKLPVRGSSELREKGPLHWKPVAKKAGFNPIGRWENWPSELHAKFDQIAGHHMRALGY